MIINLHLHNKLVIVVGGGNEAKKRIKVLLTQGCKILVIADDLELELSKLIKKKKIRFKKQKVHNTNFLAKYKPFIIITTTDNHKLNKEIVQKANRLGILAYSSDDSEISSFANPAIIDFENVIQIGIFTSGKSPIMSKRLKNNIENVLRKSISRHDVALIKMHEGLRKIVKKHISSMRDRRQFLEAVINDRKIKQLIKDGKVKNAEKRALVMLENWQ